jgi:hypothetical protein
VPRKQWLGQSVVVGEGYVRERLAAPSDCVWDLMVRNGDQRGGDPFESGCEGWVRVKPLSELFELAKQFARHPARNLWGGGL